MHARIQKVLLQGVNNSDSFVGFFVGGERIQIPLKVGHHRSASKTPFKWHFADGPIVAQHWLIPIAPIFPYLLSYGHFIACLMVPPTAIT